MIIIIKLHTNCKENSSENDTMLFIDILLGVVKRNPLFFHSISCKI